MNIYLDLGISSAMFLLINIMSCLHFNPDEICKGWMDVSVFEDVSKILILYVV